MIRWDRLAALIYSVACWLVLAGAALAQSVVPIVLPSALGTPTMVISDVRLSSNITIGCEIVQRADGATMTVGWLNDVCDKAAADRFAAGTALTVLTKLDQSGNGNNCTNATAATQPNYTALNEINGIRPTTFSGTNSSGTLQSFLRCVSAVDRAAVTVYTVAAVRVSLSQQTWWEFTDAGFTTSYALLYNPGSGTAGISANYGGGLFSALFPRANLNVTSFSLSSTTGSIVRTNGAQFTSAANSVAQVVGGFQFGKSTFGNLYNTASDVYAIVIYGAAHTSIQMQTVEPVLSASFNVPTTWRNRLVYGGNSLMANAFATLNQQAPWQGGWGRDPNWEVYTMAVYGQTQATEFANRANFRGLYNAAQYDVVVIADPTNDIAAATFSSAADAVQWATDFFGTTGSGRATNTTLPYVAALQVMGYPLIVVPTVIARSTWDDTTNWRNTARTTYNNLVATNCSVIGCTVSNRAVNPLFADRSVVTNSLCYQADQIHLTNFCHGVLAGIDKTAILSGGAR